MQATLSPRTVACMNICHHCHQVVYFHNFFHSFLLPLSSSSPSSLLFILLTPSSFPPHPPSFTAVSLAPLISLQQRCPLLSSATETPPPDCTTTCSSTMTLRDWGERRRVGGVGPHNHLLCQWELENDFLILFHTWPPPSSPSYFDFKHIVCLLHSTAHVAVR